MLTDTAELDLNSELRSMFFDRSHTKFGVNVSVAREVFMMEWAFLSSCKWVRAIISARYWSLRRLGEWCKIARHWIPREHDLDIIQLIFSLGQLSWPHNRHYKRISRLWWFLHAHDLSEAPVAFRVRNLNWPSWESLELLKIAINVEGIPWLRLWRATSHC